MIDAAFFIAHDVTPYELNERIKTYRAMIARWQWCLENDGPESLRDDINDLESYIRFLMGLIERIGFANANGKLRRRVGKTKKGT